MQRAAIFAGMILLTAVFGAAAYGADPANIPKYIAAAVADPTRPAADTARDANRKPAETLAFAGVKPGDQVVEFGPGKGYYTRLLSGVVGANGKVTTVSSQPPPNAPPPPVQAIAADPHYGNVHVTLQHVAELKLPANVDLVWTSQNYHDFHDIPDVQVASLNRAVFDALKPGGIYFVLDHAAESGSGTRDTNTLHRIDEETVKQEVKAAGFEPVDESNVLRNKDDPHSGKVFEPPIQGHTDQFLLKFRKPKK
jgi:predicted methyltransferase